MKQIVNRSFGFNLSMLRLLGLYPDEDHSWIYLTYGYVTILYFMLLEPILGLVFYMKEGDVSAMDTHSNVLVIVGLIVLTPKMLQFLKNAKKIRECVNYMETAIIETINDKQKRIIDDCVWVCQRNTKFFVCCLIFDAAVWIFRPLFSWKREFPMELWLPFDPKTNGVSFYVMYALVSTGLPYVGILCGLIDPLITGLTYHAAGQLKLLKDNLECLHEYADIDLVKMYADDVLKSQVMYHMIEKCIQHHYIIISFVNKIEDTFSWVIFCQFFASTGMICFCCLALIKLEVGPNFFLMASFLFAILIELYFYCYYGTTLYEESNSLTTAVYLGSWYEYDLKCQKALIIFMERSKNPIILTIGKVFALLLTSFTEILKKSYSLLAVLNNTESW